LPFFRQEDFRIASTSSTAEVTAQHPTRDIHPAHHTARDQPVTPLEGAYGKANLRSEMFHGYAAERATKPSMTSPFPCFNAILLANIDDKETNLPLMRFPFRLQNPVPFLFAH
jgi:hypothetical protein